MVSYKIYSFDNQYVRYSTALRYCINSTHLKHIYQLKENHTHSIPIISKHTKVTL